MLHSFNVPIIGHFYGYNQIKLTIYFSRFLWISSSIDRQMVLISSFCM